jgi:hypothetical protein
MLKSDLEAYYIEIKELKQRLDHSSLYKVFKDLIILLAIRFFYLLVKFVVLLRVSLCMLPKRTPS